MSKYDQDPTDHYGVCVTCELILSTEEAASPDRRSHTYRRHNPTREQRIRSMVDNIVENAIYDAIYALIEELDGGEVTESEIAGALKYHGDFADEWERRDAA